MLPLLSIQYTVTSRIWTIAFIIAIIYGIIEFPSKQRLLPSLMGLLCNNNFDKVKIEQLKL